MSQHLMFLISKSEVVKVIMSVFQSFHDCMCLNGDDVILLLLITKFIRTPINEKPVNR